MTRPPRRDLMAFARLSGLDATPCPSCGTPGTANGRSSDCTNCGGSGRLWISLRGSLSDEGLERLRRMLGRGIAAQGRS